MVTQLEIHKALPLGCGRTTRHGMTLAFAALLGMMAVSSHAREPLGADSTARIVSDDILAQQRGGFFTSDGLQVAFGLEQTTIINGEVIHRSVLRELSPLGELSDRSLRGMEQVLIRNGVGGADVQRHFSDQGWVTIIQNDLHGQRIQHQLTLDMTLDNLSMPRSDLGRSLERQLIESARPL